MNNAQATVLILFILLVFLEAVHNPTVKAFVTQQGPWGTFFTTLNQQKGSKS